jgi:hypothetical protein
MIPAITKVPRELLPFTRDESLLTTVGVRIDNPEELIADPDLSQQ